VLGLVVTDEIFHAHPDEQEGRLAKVRSAAVKTESLAAIARELGLGRFVRLGRGEAASGGADKDSILADTLEAVIGAVYLDQGFAAAYDLVERLFGDRLVELAGRGAALDYKTSLQELTAARFDVLPRYEVTDEGPDHARPSPPRPRRRRGRRAGRGRNKKQAEQRAAREAYRRLTAHAEPERLTVREPEAERRLRSLVRDRPVGRRRCPGGGQDEDVLELPEVEVLRKDLEKEVVGKRIKDVVVQTPGIVRPFHRNRPEFVKALEGRKVEAARRRGRRSSSTSTRT
jgi:ribonuclease III